MIVVIGSEGFIGKSFINYLKKNHPNEKFIGVHRNNYEILSRTYFSNDELVNVFFCISNDLQYKKNNPIQIYLDSERESIKRIVSFINSSKLRLIYLSSAGTIYKSTGKNPVTEKSKIETNNNYGEFKLQMEKYLIKEFSDKNKFSTILRVSNVYGELQKSNLGQGIVSTLIYNLLNKKETTIFFKGIELRDYLYIDDFCAALFCLTKGNFIENISIYNVSFGHSISTSSMLEIILTNFRRASIPIDTRLIKFTNSSFGTSPLNSVVNSSKFRSEFNWKPKVDLSEGIMKIINYFNGNYNVY